ncbi:TPA: DNA-binding protein, partial [Clostridioides difficile]|nr:DNA-binding protein [Clostridioides difficile]
MGIFKTKMDEDWKVNYIKEFNEMRDSYESKLQKKQFEVDSLKSE